MDWTRAKADNGGRIVEMQKFAGNSLPAPWSNNSSATGSDSFFNRYPKYKALESAINKSVAPDLYADLQLHEEMRTRLLELLFQLAIDK